MVKMNKREFLAASVGAGLGLTGIERAFAQQGSAPSNGRPPLRKAKTTKLFRSPAGFPNAIAVTPEGLWIGEQKLSGQHAVQYHLPEPKDLTENAWLVDWNGKVLKTVATQSRNTSGMAVGGGYVWMCANEPPEGVFQVDMNSKQLTHRQIPLGPLGRWRRMPWRDVARWEALDRFASAARGSQGRSRFMATGIHDPVLSISGETAISRDRLGQRRHLANHWQRLQTLRRLPAWTCEIRCSNRQGARDGRLSA